MEFTKFTLDADTLEGVGIRVSKMEEVPSVHNPGTTYKYRWLTFVTADAEIIACTSTSLYEGIGEVSDGDAKADKLARQEAFINFIAGHLGEYEVVQATDDDGLPITIKKTINGEEVDTGNPLLQVNLKPVTTVMHFKK